MNVVEKVADALRKTEMGDGDWLQDMFTVWVEDDTDDMARLAHAAIAATLDDMAEPSEGMLAADKPCPTHWDLEGPDRAVMNAALLVDRATSRQTWQAMLAQYRKEMGE